MKISSDGKPMKFESRDKITSIGIDKYGNVYAYKIRSSTTSTSKEELTKVLDKSRF